MPKGTTSKETVETRSYGKKLFFMVKFPEFLGGTCFNSLKGRVDGVEVPSETNAVTFVSDMHCMGLHCDFEGQYFATGNLFGSLNHPGRAPCKTPPERTCCILCNIGSFHII